MGGMAGNYAGELSGVALAPAEPRSSPLDRLANLQPVELLAIVAMALALAARFAARPHAPLWIDEAATGAIISQQTFQQFWQQVYWEVSSPLYFLVMRPWQSLFGLSNEALRAPSVIFSMAAPLSIAIARIPGLTRTDRLTWAAMLALWVPGIGYAQDARCYALELLFATLQTLAYVRLLHATTFRTTVAWVALAGLTTATHYDAAILAVAQGLLFIALKRGEAIRRWPAILLIAPVVAMMLWQEPEMTRFMQPDTTWYRIQDASDVLRDVFYLTGGILWPLLLPVVLISTLIDGLRRRNRPAANIPNAVMWAGLASVAGAAVLIGLATMKPIMAYRYLAPFAPGAVLFVLVTMRHLGRGAQGAVSVSLLVCGIAYCGLWLATGAQHRDSVIDPLNYEEASNRLMNAGVHRVVFTWDNPNARVMHKEQLEAFGGFFFHRAGVPVEVVPLQIGPHDDPNVLLLDTAEASDAAIVWVYDTWVHGTAAITYAPLIPLLDPRWSCEETGEKTFGIVTCLRGALDP